MTATNLREYIIRLRRPFATQIPFVRDDIKRKVVREGRRGGKTTGAAILACEAFLKKRRVLYGTPTTEQLGTFWKEVKRAFAEPIERGFLRKNEVEHFIELPGTEVRIKAKTAWNADTFRGDYADELIYDEWQLMNEDAWGLVGVPMLLDNNGNATFIYTPPSLASRSTTKARDPMHAAKMYKRAEADTTGRWKVYHATSHDNPHISKEALTDIVLDMTNFAYRQEILAEDLEDNPAALWKREWIDRVTSVPDFYRVAVAVDPTGSAGGDECGIIGGGVAIVNGVPNLYVLDDASLQGTPNEWAQAAVALYNKLDADVLFAEKNYGGEMVERVLEVEDSTVRVELVHATRGKQIRAEPISVAYQKGRCHHVGFYPLLEDEMCQWQPGQLSPNRLDALVWLATPFVGKSLPPSTKDMPQAEAQASIWDRFGELGAPEWAGGTQ